MNRFETTVSDKFAFVDSKKINMGWTSAPCITDFLRRVIPRALSSDEDKMKEPDEHSTPNESAMEVAWRSALVEAWISSKMEADKKMGQYSIAAVGILVTLLSTGKIQTSVAVILFSISLGIFLFGTISSIAIFKCNPKHLEEVMNKTATRSPLLKFLDLLLIHSFLLGILISVVAAIATQINK